MIPEHLIEAWFHRTGYAATEWAVINFKGGFIDGYQLAIDEQNKLLDEVEKEIEGFCGRDGYEKMNDLMKKLKAHRGEK